MKFRVFKIIDSNKLLVVQTYIHFAECLAKHTMHNYFMSEDLKKLLKSLTEYSNVI